MENMAFDHLLRWKMVYTTNCPILTYAFLFKGWESVLFELGSERVEQNFMSDELIWAFQLLHSMQGSW